MKLKTKYILKSLTSGVIFLMFLGKSHKMVKVLASLLLALVMETALAPSLTSGRFFSEWMPDDGGSAKASRQYVLEVLRENRTGLGALEELRLAEVILMESVAGKLDPLFVLALIKTESTFYNWSRSFRGAVGLMQILPSTGEEIAGELNLSWKGEETLLDPYTNVRMGVYYISRLHRRYKDLETALAAYNVGPGRMDAWIREGSEPGAGYAQRAGYAEKVFENYRQFRERAEYY